MKAEGNRREAEEKRTLASRFMSRALPSGWAVVLLIGMCAGGLGCGSSRETTVKGHLIVACADSALPLIEREARAFMILYPEARIDVVSTDSRGALVRLFNGEAGMAVISRDVGDDEKRAAAEGNLPLSVYRIAVDGVAFIVHPQNRVDSLSVGQVSGLLGGKAGSWSEVGGSDRPVVPVVRDRNSGTYEVVRQQVLAGEGFVGGVVCRTSQEVVDRVASEPGGIGCVGLAWLKEGRVKALRIAQKPGEAFVDASAPSVYKNRYPIRRPLLACTTGGAVEASPRAGFLAFLTSQKGQIIVESEGLVPDTVPERIIQLTR